MGTSLSRPARFSSLGEKLTDPEIVRLMNITLSDPALLSLAAGFTDNAVMPVKLVEEIVRTLGERGGEPEHLQYGLNAGRPGLRAGIARFLSSYPGEETLSLNPDNIIITNGSQQALYLSIQVLCDPGDIVLVEQPTYFVFLELLKGLGVQPLSMPVKGDGRLDLKALRALFGGLAERGELERVKAVYSVTYYANPSSRCMPEEDKEELGALLAELPVAVAFMEDAAYRELYFENPSPERSHLSLSSFAGTPSLYTGTFTKPFATGMKVGFAHCSDEEWLKNLLTVKGQQDFGTSNFNQAIIETVLNDGRYGEFLKTLHRHYARKTMLLDTALREEGLPALGWSWDRPEGGFLLWLKAPERIDTGFDSAFCRACIENGVLYVPGELFFAEGRPHNYLRLSLGVLDGERLRKAARRFADAARRCARASQPFAAAE